MTSRPGFSLIEALLAVVVAAAGFTVLLRGLAQTAEAGAAARRWLAMARAAETEVARLESAYLAAAPGCVPPPAGATTTAEGVTVTWSVAGDSLAAAFTLEARAGLARRTLIDTVVAAAVCR
ncbi:MAG: hypothetical protein FJ206_13615 [Gemmatimonadetes bacterium]|nr:hypothetical protein [Gemmatimonadota bacterium]